MGFSSVPRLTGWSFQQLIHEGILPFFPLLAGFPPLISCEKTAPLHQSLQKSLHSFVGWQKLSRYAGLTLKYIRIDKATLMPDLSGNISKEPIKEIT